ncbi:MAG: hypothetical protein SGILL_007516 [Bacillariaceae sp.]
MVDQQRRVLTQQEGCVLTIEETEYYDEEVVPLRSDAVGSRRRSLHKSKNGGDKEWVCELTGVDAENAEGQVVHVHGLDETFFEDNGVESGETTLFVPDATIEGTEMTITDTTDMILEKKSSKSSKSAKSAKNESGRKRKLQRRLADGLSSTDQATQAKTLNKERTVLVVRATSTSASASQLTNDVFTDSSSLKSTYENCSYDKLKINPASGNSNIVNGVLTVSIGSTNGAEAPDVRDSMDSAARSKLGISSLSAKYDHVMFCIPSGTEKCGTNGW